MAFLQDSQPDLRLLAKSGGCSVYQLRNESGEGTMTVYEVFPGATILYNDFHMAYCDSSFETRQDLLCIDYCREGRMEYAVGNDAFSYRVPPSHCFSSVCLPTNIIQYNSIIV